MTHPPFGLTPQMFSIAFLVLFLGGGTLLSLLLSRKKRAVVMPAPSPGQPYVDLVSSTAPSPGKSIPTDCRRDKVPASERQSHTHRSGPSRSPSVARQYTT
jgi:hypothetical protein